MKRQALQRSRVDLNEAILEVIALTRYEMSRHGIALNTQLAQGLPLVQADRPRELTITSGREGAQAVLIAVRDSGVGVDRASCDKLFDAFYTT